MRSLKPNLPLGIGLLLFSAVHIINRFFVIPDIMHYILMLSAFSLEMWGVIKATRSPLFKNSKLRQWKLRLIGKELK